LSELDKLAKPWHYEFWSDIPDDLPFSLVHLYPKIPKTSSTSASKRTSMISNESSDWEWEYYSQSEDECDGDVDDCRLLSEE